MKNLELVHVELNEANEFVAQHHRHHKPARGHRFSIGAARNGELAGVVIVGRPVARMCDHRTTLEVTRLCTDGSDNTCSFLYGAAARAGKILGYEKIQTYILVSEDGTSLRAAGWEPVKVTDGGLWKHTTGPRNNSHPLERKVRYERVLR